MKRKQGTIDSYKTVIQLVLDTYSETEARQVSLDKLVRSVRGDGRTATFLVRQGYVERIGRSYIIKNRSKLIALKENPESMYEGIRNEKIYKTVITFVTNEPKKPSLLKRVLNLIGWN